MQTQTYPDYADDRPESPEQRLRTLVDEAMDDHEKNQALAFEQWRNHVETEPALMLAIMGIEWRRLSQNWFNTAVLREAAQAMSNASKTQEAKAKHKQTSAKHRKAAAIATELGILEDMVINGKALRYCTRQELQLQHGKLSREWRFLSDLIALLPAPESRVGEMITPTAANALWKAAKKQAAA